MYGYRSFLRRFIFSCLALCYLVASPLLMAMPTSQYNAIADYWRSHAGESAAGFLTGGNIQWLYEHRGSSAPFDACDPSEPNSQTGWGWFEFVRCSTNPGVCDYAAQFGLVVQISGVSYYPKVVGTTCAVDSGGGATGCASPDNAGICDYVASVGQVAARAESVASAAFNDITSTASQVSYQTDVITNQTNALNSQMTNLLSGRSDIWGGTASAGALLGNIKDWTEWSAHETSAFREYHQIPFMQQSLAAASTANTLLGQIANGGITASFNTLPIEYGLVNQTNALNAANASLRDVVQAGNSELITLEQSLNSTAQSIGSDTAEMVDSLDALGAAQRDTTSAITTGVDYLAEVIAQNAPSVSVDLSSTNSLLGSANDKLDSLSSGLSAIDASVQSGSADVVEAVDGLRDMLSPGDWSSIPRNGLEGFSDGQGVGSGLASAVDDGSSLPSLVIDFATLDGTGFLGAARPSVLPSFSLSLPQFLSVSGFSWSHTFHFSDLELLFNVLKTFMWIGTWFAVLRISLRG